MTLMYGLETGSFSRPQARPSFMSTSTFYRDNLHFGIYTITEWRIWLSTLPLSLWRPFGWWRGTLQYADYKYSATRSGRRSLL